MQEILTKQEIENLDLSKVAALQQKRTLAFVNHFLITTVQFLNTFSRQCEQRLMKFEGKLEKINAAMVLLEARLSSIPEVNDVSPVKENSKTIDSSQTKSEDIKIEKPIEHPNNEIEQKTQETESSGSNNTNKAKPEYERFIKMVQVGVPLEAVKLKVSLEGLDPNELESLLKK